MEVALTPKQITELDRAERSLADAMDALSKLEQCGRDCTRHKLEVEQIRTNINAIKANFVKRSLTNE